jgi:hypothetical protein
MTCAGLPAPKERLHGRTALALERDLVDGCGKR